MAEIKKTPKMLELEARLGEDLGVYLRREYEEKHRFGSEIASELKVYEGTLYRYFKRYDLRIRPISETQLPANVQIPSKEQLYSWYIQENKTIGQIALDLGVSDSVVNRWLIKKDIPLRHGSEARIAVRGILRPPKSELEKLYQEKETIKEVARALHISPITLGRWFREDNIEIRNSSRSKVISKEELERLYCRELKSCRLIAEQLGYSIDTVSKLLKKHGIQKRSHSQNLLLPKGIEKLSKQDLDRMYNHERKSLNDIADIVGVTNATIKNWLLGYDMAVRTAAESMLLKKGIIQPTKYQLENWYNQEGKYIREIAKEIGVDCNTVSRWIKKHGIHLMSSQRITSPQQFLEFLRQDPTAANLAAIAAGANGQAASVERIIEDIYEGRFKDREQLHGLIQENRPGIYDLIREGLTNLGTYLGDFSVHDRQIFPVLMGEIIAHIPEEKVLSLEDRFLRLLRNEYGPRFNQNPEETMKEIKGKVEGLEGKRKGLYQKLLGHYQDVLELKQELS